MDAMQDGQLLKLLRGDGSIKVDDRLYTRLSNENMPNFLQRIRNEEYAQNARKEREAIAKAVETRVLEVPVKEHIERPDTGDHQVIQTVEEILQNQATVLERRIGSLTQALAIEQGTVKRLNNRLKDAQREYQKVCKFLKKEKNKGTDDTHEVPPKVGTDIPSQDTEGRETGSDRVGEQDYTQD